MKLIQSNFDITQNPITETLPTHDWVNLVSSADWHQYELDLQAHHIEVPLDLAVDIVYLAGLLSRDLIPDHMLTDEFREQSIKAALRMLDTPTYLRVMVCLQWMYQLNYLDMKLAEVRYYDAKQIIIDTKNQESLNDIITAHQLLRIVASLRPLFPNLPIKELFTDQEWRIMANAVIDYGDYTLGAGQLAENLVYIRIANPSLFNELSLAALGMNDIEKVLDGYQNRGAISRAAYLKIIHAPEINIGDCGIEFPREDPRVGDAHGNPLMPDINLVGSN